MSLNCTFCCDHSIWVNNCWSFGQIFDQEMNNKIIALLLTFVVIKTIIIEIMKILIMTIMTITVIIIINNNDL